MKRCCQYQKIEKVHKKGLTAVWLYGIISKRWKRLDVWWRLIAGVAQLAEQLICNQQVAGSSPITSSIMGEFPSGQRGQTVNLLLFSFGGPNPPSPTKQKQTIFLMVCFCLGRVDNRTIFAQQKHGSPKQPQRRAAAADCVVGSTRDFPLNARGVRKMRERTVPTLALICTPKVRHFWCAYQFTVGFLLIKLYYCCKRLIRVFFRVLFRLSRVP